MNILITGGGYIGSYGAKLLLENSTIIDSLVTGFESTIDSLKKLEILNL